PLVNKFHNHHTVFLDYQDDDQIKVISQIGNCDCVKQAIAHMNEFYVPDNTGYLFAEASRIIKPNYVPTETDVVHARASTTGVHEITFGFRRFSIRLIDVGGQKTERRKVSTLDNFPHLIVVFQWIHCFENVTAILFVIALSCYDQYMDEDPDKVQRPLLSPFHRHFQNRMEDCIELFNSMYHNEFLRKSSFILFLNKKDLFEEKLKHVSLAKFFPT
ncbi:heterotrimeric G protein alpha subunit 4, partial [Aphelenchoides avenae]